MKKNHNVIVYYHEECFDGFGAAWAAWKKLGKKASYVGLSPDTLPERIPSASLLFFLDICPRDGKLGALKKKGNTVVVIDHHVSSVDAVLGADDHVFDIGHSGSVLAWRYFFPKKKVPRLLRYIEDGDLWTLRYPQTRLIQNMLAMEDFDFVRWSGIAGKVDTLAGRREIISSGRLIERYREHLIKESVERAQLVLFEGHRVYALNEPARAIRSEAAHRLYTTRPPMALVWSQEKDVIRVSLRSDGSVNVAKIAEKYGGGGHRKAAGMDLPLGTKLPWKPIKK